MPSQLCFLDYIGEPYRHRSLVCSRQPAAGIKPLFANEVIYFEWPICIITFLLVAMLDKNKIKEVVEVPEEDE